jgi:AraC-like DNA-binding protein
MRGELSNSEIIQKSAEHHITLQSPYVCVLLVDMDGYYLFQKQYDEKDRSLLMYALRKMVEEIVEEKLPIVTVTSTLGQIAIVTDSNLSTLEPDLLNAAGEILVRVRQYFTFTVTVSLSLKRQGLTGIPIAYREASELLGYRLLLGDDRLITQDDIKPSVQQSRMTLVRWQKQIVSSLVNGNQEEAETVLKELVKSLPQYIQSSETVLGLFAYLIGELEFLIVDSGGETLHLFDEDPYKRLYGMDTLGHITDWLIESVFPSIIGYMQGMDKQKRLVQQALLYTKEHYLTDLSLQQTADHLNVPHYQLSKAFKEETGRNFSDYLIHLRIEKAKEWLVHTDMELKEISEKLRYATVQNLSRIFKQMVGVPPGQYRKQNRM